MDPIYLDYNATTPLDPAVAAAMLPYLEAHFGNPSSGHIFGQRSRRAVETAREQIARLLAASPGEIIFTSGGTEANNLAIRGVATAREAQGRHVITSAIEHPAVAEVCHHLEASGFRVTFVPVDADGLVDPGDVEKAFTPDTILVTIMHANNEVGTIQPVREIAGIAHQHGALLHTDAAQSVGKIPVRVDELGADLLSIAGHKLYAPKGVGALYIREGITLAKLMHGAAHEGGRRPGTENVLEIVGLGCACELAGEHLLERAVHMRELRDRLEEGVTSRLPSARINGHRERRLPNTSSMSFPGIEAATILSELTGIAASAGAACHADEVVMSETLAAMKVPPEVAMGTVRFSTGMKLTAAEVEQAIPQIVRVIEKLGPGGGEAR